MSFNNSLYGNEKNPMNAQNEYSIFLVDDDRMFLISLKNSLQQQFGSLLNISEYQTGEECIQNINKKPDIIILDYNLSDKEDFDTMNGLEVLREVHLKSQNTVIIMLSGQDNMQVAVDCMKNGAYEYLSKSESAFVRIPNSIKNAIENIKSKKKSDKYIKLNIRKTIIIITIIIIDVIGYYACCHTI
jgi:two-component system, OmpR family, response regulator